MRGIRNSRGSVCRVCRGKITGNHHKIMCKERTMQRKALD